MGSFFEINDLHFQYPGASSPLIRNLTFSIPTDATFGIVGLSGSGKTTLLNILSLLWECPELAANTVRFSVDGASDDYYDLTPRRRVELRQRQFGFIFQNSYLLPHLSALDNLVMPAALQGLTLAERRELGMELLACADPTGRLGEKAAKPAYQLSQGQRQRIAILRAMIHNPRLIFADEPFSSLDAASTDHIIDLLIRWRDNELGLPGSKVPRTLVLVTHELERISELAAPVLVLTGNPLVSDRILQRSEVVRPGTLSELLRPAHIEKEDSSRRPTIAVQRSQAENTELTSVGFMKFAHWFARQDLFAAKAKRVTLVMLLTLFLVSALVTAAFGLICGYEQARLADLRSKPNSRSLYIGSPTVRDEITPTVRTQVEAALSEKMASMAKPKATAFHVLEANFLYQDGSESATAIEGRTVAPDDPLWAYVHHPKRFTSAEPTAVAATRIVITPFLRAKLHIKPNAQTPSSLTLRADDLAERKIGVAGETTAAIPGGYHFLIAEDDLADFDALRNSRTYSQVTTGAVPSNWRETALLVRLNRELGKDLSELGLSRQISWIEDRGETYWLLTSVDPAGFTAEEWNHKGESLRGLLTAAALPLPKTFGDFSFEKSSRDREPSAHDGLAIYVADVIYIKAVADVVTKIDGRLFIDPDIVRQVDEIAGVTRNLFVMLSVVAFIIILIAAGNLLVILMLKAATQVAAIGMLKAIGIDADRLILVYLVQGFVLWSRGCLPGMVMGAVIGQSFAWAACLYTNNPFFVFYAPGWIAIPFFAGGSFACCLLSTVIATRYARRTQPSQCLVANM